MDSFSYEEESKITLVLTTRLTDYSQSSCIDISESSALTWTYDVFLNFRGEDTRRSFVEHLYQALNSKGVFTYKNNQILEKGKSISPELLQSIVESLIAIIVFSKDYASSTWFLEELVNIMESHNNNVQIVFPIFYDVDPSDVRK
ncbi:hypothetical protein ACH5RR_009652 [Cinchona calisaya]|uniref:TIR domain-containing protein n=1 Tax=Cinchona calisaya TaxID=153742 RepID=A0ABD3AES3_9GENT